MSKSAIVQLFYCVAICILNISRMNGQNYQEQYRLQLHFSMPSGWANDPNGLIYHNGFYHLFYQHNPVSTVWGPMHWGHAISPDLIHWEHLPIALEPFEMGDIFSGCCVVDTNNVTGWSESVTQLPVIAIYTLHNESAQAQSIAYSSDNGVSWTHYDMGRPVIANPGIEDFRDPNVFERNGVFYMTLAVKDRIRFYSSIDLKEWQELSDFGLSPNEGDKSGVWECPAMVTLKDERGIEHDILIVSENGDERGSLLQYFVGKFDGTTFKTYNQSRVLWAENGFDNYAAVPYHNDPNGRIILIGWMSNWLYGQVIPTSGWRGQMTIPRKLGLRTIDGDVHLIQQPIDELYDLYDTQRHWSLVAPEAVQGADTYIFELGLRFRTDSILSMEYTIDIGHAHGGKIGLQFSNSHNEFISFHYDITERIYELDRRNSGNVSFNERFANTLARVKRIATDNKLTARIILDVASIEIFADDGLNTFSALFFPSEPYEVIKVIGALSNVSSYVTIERLSVNALNSIWHDSTKSSGPSLHPASSVVISIWMLLFLFSLSTIQFD